MVVTSCATQCQTQKTGPCGVDQIRKLVLFLHERQVDVWTLDDVMRPCHEVTCPDWLAESIAGNLLEDELIVRFIRIQSFDDPVAVRPGIWAFSIRLKSLRFPKPNQVQPMASPPLSVARAFQNIVDQVCPCVRGVVIQKLFDLLRHGWQAMHDQIEPSNSGAAIGLGRER